MGSRLLWSCRCREHAVSPVYPEVVLLSAQVAALQSGGGVVSQEAVVNDKEKAKYGRADHQGCVLPSISSMLLECHGENRQWRFYYATNISLFCVCSKGIGQDLNAQVFHFANLLLLWHALYFSTRRACPWFPMCFVSCVCCPECSWAATENWGHLNTGAGAWPASVIGHVRRMTVPDKAPRAIFCGFVRLCVKCFSLNADFLLAGAQVSS